MTMTNDMISAQCGFTTFGISGTPEAPERAPNVVLHVSCTSLPVVLLQIRDQDRHEHMWLASLALATVNCDVWCVAAHFRACTLIVGMEPKPSPALSALAPEAVQLQLDANIAMDGTWQLQ
jgi:hypothetical protein